ncbi:MAG: hypothetical protein IIC73_07915, partial [Armatimonadetes bacterium]|nr:hypothetical protein [Armatimonadota bacterium]
MGRKLFVSMVVALLACVAGAQDVGLLLGLEGKNGESHTVWIGQQGVAVFARKAGDGYWLWRDDGFWHIVSEDLTWSGGRATVTITDPEGKVTVIKRDEESPARDYHVMYVAPKTIGLKWALLGGQDLPQSGLGSDRDSKVYWIARYKNLKWSDLGTAVEVGSVFDRVRVRLFTDDGKSAGDSFPGYFESEASPTSWTLTRELGQWHLTGSILAKDPALFPLSQEYSAGVVSDRSLGGNHSPGLHWFKIWFKIGSEYPRAFEFTTSPDGKLTVIVTPTDVFVHRSSGSSLGRRVQRVRVQATRIVMTQWLEGADVRKVAS